MTTKDEAAKPQSFSMPESLVEELRAVARENGRSLSAEARLALKAWLAQKAAA